jgi:uncharacterized membrane protein (UPF0127 family)
VLGSLCANPGRAGGEHSAARDRHQVRRAGVLGRDGDDREEKTTGLMYRKELPDGKGMLFDFSPEQQISMWMKNTYISLDMIFIRADGRILRIAENTEPLSTKIISSGGLAKGVLEVIAGTAQKYGIQPGDRVAHPLFNKPLSLRRSALLAGV